ncbi:DUF1566 domain-containing protein [Desulfococcaceae bacterium HSG8]|nr:DUF1566 domain-containing protein [Desulfococcaceae bacterium HSG8]
MTDNLTGLIWLRNANCFAMRLWTTALDDCDTLASGSCGLSDGSGAGQWRLPGRNELASLLDLSQANPALPSGHPFTSVQNSYYWSSTSRSGPPGNIWCVDFNVGGIGYGADAYSAYVLPVRDGQ